MWVCVPVYLVLYVCVCVYPVSPVHYTHTAAQGRVRATPCQDVYCETVCSYKSSGRVKQLPG